VHNDGVLHVVDVALLRAGGDGPEAIEALISEASQVFETEPVPVSSGTALLAQRRYRLALQAGEAVQPLQLAPGTWALFSEHAPAEFGLQLRGPAAAITPQHEQYFGSHHHAPQITSIGLVESRALDARKVNDWLSYLLQSRGQDILRMKGVLQLKSESRRYVFHGVHMSFEGQLERAWPADAPRVSRLVFIGRQLDRQELEAGLAGCIA
jgi:G3E family GTPase